MCSRFAEHDIACLVPPLVRDERLLLHCSRLGNLRDMRHYWKSREVTFHYSGDPAHKRHPKRIAGFCSQYTTPTDNARQELSLEWKNTECFRDPIHNNAVRHCYCLPSDGCAVLLAIRLHAAKKKSQYQETISNNMWFNLYTVQSVEIKCKFYHNNTSTTKIFIAGI
jgi:hypothetical protein